MLLKYSFIIHLYKFIFLTHFFCVFKNVFKLVVVTSKFLGRGIHTFYEGIWFYPHSFYYFCYLSWKIIIYSNLYKICNFWQFLIKIVHYLFHWNSKFIPDQILLHFNSLIIEILFINNYLHIHVCMIKYLRNYTF